MCSPGGRRHESGAGLLTLDIASLQVVAALGSILSGLIHFFPGMVAREPGRWPYWWGTGKILVGASNALGLCFDGSRLSLLERISDLFLLTGLCLCVTGLSIFSRRRLPPAMIFFLAGMMSFSVLLLLYSDHDYRLPIVVLGGTRTVLNATTAWMLISIAQAEKLRTAWVMGLLFAASVPLFVVRTTLLLAAWNDPSWADTAQWTADWSIGIAIILVSLSHFALLLINAERVQRGLSEQASRDHLTGALNRFGMGEIESKLRGMVTLLLIDIDRFKALNDGQGHAAGDAALRMLADLAQREMGTGGTLVRIGGDEFLCILPDHDEVTVRSIATRLSHRFDRAVAALADGPLYPSLSIGLSRGWVNGNLDSLIEQADAAMYAIKRVRHAGSPAAYATGQAAAGNHPAAARILTAPWPNPAC